MEDKTVINTAPPPPSEVKVRTMRSDLESMRLSGGGMPTFQNVIVSGLTVEKEYKKSVKSTASYVAPSGIPISQSSVSAPAQRPAASFAPTSQPDNHLMPILIVSLVALLAIAGVGIAAYMLFFK
jgi:hypothetical protein